jgi:hypothetical protein
VSRSATAASALSAPRARSVRTPRWGLPAALWLAAALVAGFTIRRYLDYFDEGLLMQAASRVAGGQWPYVDFAWPYGPGQPLVNALAFEALGRSVLWWRVLWAAAAATAALLAWDLVRRAAGPRYALAAWAAVAVTMAQPATANATPPALALGLGAVAVAAAGRQPAASRAAVAGVLAALAAAWRLDFGVVASAAVVVTMALRGTSRGALSAAGASVAATALLYLPFAVAAGPGRLWDALVTSSAGDGEWWRLPFPLVYDGRLRAWPPGALATDAKDALAYELPLLGLAILAIAVVVLLRAQRERRLPPAAGGVLVLVVGAVGYVASRADELHAQPLLVCACVLAALAAALASHRTAAVLAVLVGLVTLAGAANRASALFRPPQLEPLRLDGARGVRVPGAEARALPPLASLVDRLVPAGAPVYVAPRRSDLVTSTAPLIHFLVDRPNVLRRDVLLQARPEEQARIVAVLRRERPVVIRWTDPRSSAPEPNRRGRPSGSRALDEHLARAYELRARFGAFDVLVPRP